MKYRSLDKMIEIHNRTLIKGIPDHKLENNLKAYKKGQLLQIAENHQLLMKKSYTKAKIIEQLKRKFWTNLT